MKMHWIILSFFFNGKLSALVLIQPNDEEADMKRVEETVRSIQVAGLFWGACKLNYISKLSAGFSYNILKISQCLYSKACPSWLWNQVVGD